MNKMRIVIDILGMQTNQSKNRGVGRYISNIIKEFVKISYNHEVILLANDNYSDTEESLQKIFGNVKIAFWSYRNWPDTRALEKDREKFILELRPDIVYMLSLQEGADEKAVTSIKTVESNCLWVTNLPDVIPIIFKEEYLKDSSSWYDEKIKHTKNSDYIITGSNFSKDRISELLSFDKSKIFIVPPAVDRTVFNSNDIFESDSKEATSTPYILFVSGYNPHKNAESLIKAYSILPNDIRSKYKLLLIGKNLASNLRDFINKNDIEGVEFLESVSDDELVNYYKGSSLFVFPSYAEGFGIPPLESMACGIPTITSRAHSLPEVTGMTKAMFNPLNIQEISDMMLKGLTDDEFRKKLIANGLERANCFSWKQSAEYMLECFEQIYKSYIKIKNINDIKWWHSIKLPDGIITPGLKSYQVLCDESNFYFNNISLKDKTVIDIGAWDGFMSFEAERLGAKRVLATDHYCWSGPGWGTKDGFNLAHRQLNSKVESLDVDVFDLSPEIHGKFDVVLFLGVMYHLADPFSGLRVAASMTDNLLIVESTLYETFTEEAVLRYHFGSDLNGDESNLWSPNELCLTNMLKDLGFKQIETIINHKQGTPRLIAKAWKN